MVQELSKGTIIMDRMISAILTFSGGSLCVFNKTKGINPALIVDS